MKTRFVKSLASFLAIFLFTLGAAAQNSPANCAVTKAPSLIGLRLGMTPAEARGVFGKDLKIKVKTDGDRVFFQNYIGKKAPRSLAGVRALYLRFLDGGLYQIEIFYDESANFQTLETFAENLAARMNFPAAGWQIANNKAVIDCGAFTLVADKPVDPRVALTDTAKLTEAEARRKNDSQLR